MLVDEYLSRLERTTADLRAVVDAKLPTREAHELDG